jgi:pseudouridine-5'-monophosphatase
VLAEYGQVYDEELRSHIIGRDEVEGANIVINAKKLPLGPHEFLRKRELLLKELFPTAQPMPGTPRHSLSHMHTTVKPLSMADRLVDVTGAKELTAYFHKNNIPMAVATSSVKEAVKLKLQQHQEWFKVFSYLISGDDEQVKHGKPAPDIFLAAARGIDLDPAHCLVFEDSPSGAEAGANARGIVVAVPDPIMSHERYPRANLIIKSLKDFDPEVFGLPPFEQTCPHEGDAAL